MLLFSKSLTNPGVISIRVSNSDNEIDSWSIAVISAVLAHCTLSAACVFSEDTGDSSGHEY